MVEPKREVWAIDITGVVQGVGFRPWVYRLATELQASGRVSNQAHGVRIEIAASPQTLRSFIHRLKREAPPAAHIESLSSRVLSTGEGSIAAFDTSAGFVIVSSHNEGQPVSSIPPDLATCEACLREINDAADRRAGYAFNACTLCGPRYSVVCAMPYDRHHTTLDIFPLCRACGGEYEDVDDRRFHAQAVACPDCGPHLELLQREGQEMLRVSSGVEESVEATKDSYILKKAARLLREGKIVALKGLGGYHLACDATCADAVERLRERKGRDAKPFAIMVADVSQAQQWAFVNDAECKLLRSAARPVVLVRRNVAQDSALLADGVAPATHLLGLMLPYTPLHHLLMAQVGVPLVMTSGNLSDEPIAYEDADALARLADVADVFVMHNRPIANGIDDSVVRVVGDRATFIRRSRGYVPRPVSVSRAFRLPTLAVGAHLKNTFCLGHEGRAWMGPHVGDLNTLEAEEHLASSISRYEQFLGFTPDIIAHDLHPEYASTHYATQRHAQRPGDSAHVVAVQHHHAHIVSCMAEYGLTGSVLGFAFDGTGLGADGTIWGSELMRATLVGYERLATFRGVRLAGGDAAVKAPWRVALALLEDAFDGDPPLQRLPLFEQVPGQELGLVRRMLQQDINAPISHGMGRYFDGIAALCLGIPTSAYEAHLAGALEAACDGAHDEPYAFELGLLATADTATSASPCIEIDLRPTVRQVVAALLDRQPASDIAARFHRTIAAASGAALRQVAPNPSELVLTGGCFVNDRLTRDFLHEFREIDRVYRNEQVPPGDGGVALGQAVVADATVHGAF